jgi:hypothetical protein
MGNRATDQLLQNLGSWEEYSNNCTNRTPSSVPWSRKHDPAVGACCFGHATLARQYAHTTARTGQGQLRRRDRRASTAPFPCMSAARSPRAAGDRDSPCRASIFHKWNSTATTMGSPVLLSIFHLLSPYPLGKERTPHALDRFQSTSPSRSGGGEVHLRHYATQAEMR